MAAAQAIWSAIWNAISSLLSSIWATITSAIQTAISVVQSIISSALATIQALWSAGWEAVRSFVSTAWENIKSAVSSGIESAVSLVREMPGKIKNALGNLGGLLMDSGKALLRGFIDGIKSMAGAAADAAKGVVQKVRDFFPFSPAKVGPFSGRGYTTYSGKALTGDFAQAISGNASVVESATQKMMSAAWGSTASTQPALPVPAVEAPSSTQGAATGSLQNDALGPVLADLAHVLGRLQSIDDRGLFTMVKTAQRKYERI